MDRTTGTGTAPVLTPPGASWPRKVAGLLILAGMAVVALMMLPPYLDNARLARSMQEFATQEGSAALSEDVIRAQLAERAAKLGLPLDPKQIRVEKAEGRLRVEAIYTVRVDLPVYSVDLHFRPSAVSR